MRNVILVLCLMGSATAAAAQTVEVGGSVAAGCLGSDGSVCGGGTHPLIGAHAGWWAADRIELSARVARVGRPPFRSSTVFPTTVEFEVTDRSSEFVSAMFIYHFRAGKAVRPMLGFGSGGFARAERVTCRPAGCGGVRGLPPEGAHRRWLLDQILVAGLSGFVGDRWVWRGGWLAHRFANDENSTIETFVGMGYRFGKR